MSKTKTKSEPITKIRWNADERNNVVAKLVADFKGRNVKQEARVVTRSLLMRAVVAAIKPDRMRFLTHDDLVVFQKEVDTYTDQLSSDQIVKWYRNFVKASGMTPEAYMAEQDKERAGYVKSGKDIAKQLRATQEELAAAKKSLAYYKGKPKAKPKTLGDLRLLAGAVTGKAPIAKQPDLTQ
jgi:hypothetical protein